MTSPDGRWTLIFNGEIYDYAALRAELEAGGVVFRGQSDTEVLLHAWIRWGEAALDRLNGIYAFAIWDDRERTLTLVRDPLGIKPLYYAADRTACCSPARLRRFCKIRIDRTLDVARFAITCSISTPRGRGRCFAQCENFRRADCWSCEIGKSCAKRATLRSRRRRSIRL
ncbi:MAG: hypothetical protein QM811_08130 [Pirellulales bacterium]